MSHDIIVTNSYYCLPVSPPVDFEERIVVDSSTSGEFVPCDPDEPRTTFEGISVAATDLGKIAANLLAKTVVDTGLKETAEDLYLKVLTAIKAAGFEGVYTVLVGNSEPDGDAWKEVDESFFAHVMKPGDNADKFAGVELGPSDSCPDGKKQSWMELTIRVKHGRTFCQ